MLNVRNVPLQDVNDVLDKAQNTTGRYAQGVLDTLRWLNGDAGMPFGMNPNRKHPNDRPESGPLPGTATTAPDQIDLDLED